MCHFRASFQVSSKQVLSYKKGNEIFGVLVTRCFPVMYASKYMYTYLLNIFALFKRLVSSFWFFSWQGLSPN